MEIWKECSRCKREYPEGSFIKGTRVLSCCDGCRDTAREYQRERRKRIRSERPPPPSDSLHDLRKVALMRVFTMVNDSVYSAAMYIAATGARADLSFFHDIDTVLADRGTCPICLGAIDEGDEVPRIRCNHQIHHHCLILHAAASPAVVHCPLCREEIVRRELPEDGHAKMMIEALAQSSMLLAASVVSDVPIILPV